MTRAHKIILASALVLGLGGSFAQAAPMNEYFPHSLSPAPRMLRLSSLTATTG